MALDLVITALAAFWAWELFLALSPLRPPAWLQPILVAGVALGAQYIPEPFLTAAAIAGIVALLHRVVTEAPMVLHRPRRRSLPPL